MVQDSLASLPSGNNFAVLFNGGVVWTVGDKLVGDQKYSPREISVESVNGSEKNTYKWSSKKTKSHFVAESERLFEWSAVTPNQIDEAVNYVETAEFVTGYCGLAHLEAALAMEPDEIIYITGHMPDDMMSDHKPLVSTARRQNCIIHMFFASDLVVNQEFTKIMNRAGGELMRISNQGQKIEPLK